jgi:CheY-like chemotaxis protein
MCPIHARQAEDLCSARAYHGGSAICKEPYRRRRREGVRMSLDHGPAMRPARPVVLLVIDNPALFATCAYGLSANGFDVATMEGVRNGQSAIPQPDIVLIALPDERDERRRLAQALACDLRACALPMVAIARDVGTASLARARAAGCAAVCLTTCAPDTLASGLRGVLQRLEPAAQHCALVAR